ncbi:hypothetical protein ISCGN_014709 [Ixodes scapularis]
MREPAPRAHVYTRIPLPDTPARDATSGDRFLFWVPPSLAARSNYERTGARRPEKALSVETHLRKVSVRRRGAAGRSVPVPWETRSVRGLAHWWRKRREMHPIVHLGLLLFCVTKGVWCLDCFKCSSRNHSDLACEDPFHNNYSAAMLESPCMASRKNRNGLFPATACIKLNGVYGVWCLDCFKCSSRNHSDLACEDPFHNNYSAAMLESPCMASRKNRNGLFPATACIKLNGVYEETGETMVIRSCALDSGTLTVDTEIVRMSHCGGFYFDDHYVRGCLQSCFEDACNAAVARTTRTTTVFCLFWTLLTTFGVAAILEETGETMVIRSCALDSGTLTVDTEIVRMSHCGGFYFDDHYVRGCLQSCFEDACNAAVARTTRTTTVFCLFWTLLTTFGVAAILGPRCL